MELKRQKCEDTTSESEAFTLADIRIEEVCENPIIDGFQFICNTPLQYGSQRFMRARPGKHTFAELFSHIAAKFAGICCFPVNCFVFEGKEMPPLHLAGTTWQQAERVVKLLLGCAGIW